MSFKVSDRILEPTDSRPSIKHSEALSGIPSSIAKEFLRSTVILYNKLIPPLMAVEH